MVLTEPGLHLFEELVDDIVYVLSVDTQSFVDAFDDVCFGQFASCQIVPSVSYTIRRELLFLFLQLVQLFVKAGFFSVCGVPVVYALPGGTINQLGDCRKGGLRRGLVLALYCLKKPALFGVYSLANCTISCPGFLTLSVPLCG